MSSYHLQFRASSQGGSLASFACNKDCVLWECVGEGSKLGAKVGYLLLDDRNVDCTIMSGEC